MNDLGIAFAWLAVQVTLILAPALALHALATRRGPASGAWVAALSLGLVAVLCAVELTAGRGLVFPTEAALTPASAPSPSVSAPTSSPPGSTAPERPMPTAEGGWEFAKLRLTWDRFGRGAAEPAARVRPWGSVVAWLALGGMAYGLFRLLVGLWAIGASRRRARTIDDPETIGLLDNLRRDMGCTRRVELREGADLSTPATAGWLRPVVLLPDDWRSWNDDDRRAVLAHELAHVVRGDYAAGLVARFALVLNFHHPLARWLAGRLSLQQEQAADALGARFAGGREGYLKALARLALKQDGRSPRWPAREFLPDRGTLIRRIEMLRNQNGTETPDRSSSKTWRGLTSLALLGLTLGVAMLRGPALAADEPTAAPAAPKSSEPTMNEPITPLYVPDGVAGLIAFRPASIARRMGRSDILSILFSEFTDLDASLLDKWLHVDASRPGFLKLGVEDIEWATCGVRLRRVKNQQSKDGRELHTLAFVGLTVRTFQPFDWLAFVRQWGVELAQVQEGGRTYFQIQGLLKPILGPSPCVCVLDDRTIVLHEEAGIRSMLAGKAPVRAFLDTPDWNRASRGLFALALDNQDGTIAKLYDRGQPDDAAALSLLKGVSRWTLGVEDADSLALHLSAACRDGKASETIASAIAPYLKQGRVSLEKEEPPTKAAEHDKKAYLMIKRLMANLRLQNSDRSVDLRTEGFGTLADWGSILDAQIKEAKVHQQARAEKAGTTKK
jgi:beta-lactamase regulating signal transducer with metallopeptidase domain